MTNKRCALITDLNLTLAAVILWMRFGLHYGFYASADSWMRALLARSILEGHAYWINFKQDWLYAAADVSIFHYSAAHEPFLPALLAALFFVFGEKIIFAPIISYLSLGLLLFPILQISRHMFSSITFALILYAVLVLNRSTELIFEASAGLSYPSAMLCYAIACWALINSLDKNSAHGDYKILSVISITCAFYSRTTEQLLIAGLAAWTLVVGQWFLEPSQRRSLHKIFLYVLLLISPWLVWKTVHFADPFFNRVSPLVWAESGDDQFNYRPNGLYPSATTYFESHSLNDFTAQIVHQHWPAFLKAFVRNFKHHHISILILFIISSGVLIWHFRRQHSLLYVLSLIFWTPILYSTMLLICPLIYQRYLIPIYFALVFIILAGFYIFVQSASKFAFGRYAWILQSYLFAGLLYKALWFDVAYLQRFLSGPLFDIEQHQQIDSKASEEINSLIEKDAVVLVRFADIRRVFLGRLTAIEEPANLSKLKDPLAFFQRFNIRYSMVDPRGILPEQSYILLGKIEGEQVWEIVSKR